MQAPVVGNTDERPIEVGQEWAYRARGIDPLQAVEVVKLGTNRPARVLIRFIAEEHEGREEWVPPARLKVLWSERTSFEECEQRWRLVRGVARLRGTPVDDAIDMVFPNLPDWNFARSGYNADAGVLEIHNLEGLLADLEIGRAHV